MKHKTGGCQGPQRAGVLAVLAAVAVLASGCGFVHVHFGAGPAKPSYQQDLAYAHCMQTHGVPDFPDPSPSVNFNIGRHLTGAVARANHACKHLL
jgi:hypothetical protein